MPPTHNPIDTSVLFFLQLAVILVACRGVGWLAKYVGQPAVIGEMIAGVLLGPSLFGQFMPTLHAALFPTESMSVLYGLSQLGLTLYMFVVGLDFDPGRLGKHWRTTAYVSMAGILAPFAVGGVTALWLHREGRYFTEKAELLETILFMGAFMSITAFPMLARIIHESKLSKSLLGTLVLAAGAIDDAAAWCILALLLSVSTGNPANVIITFVGSIVFIGIVLILIKPLLRNILLASPDQEKLSYGKLAFVLGLVMAGASVSNAIGIHSVFGAFVIGCALPRGTFCELVKKQIEPLTLCLLVPLFFAYAGLNTRLDLVSSPWLLFVTMLIFVGACVGKGVACWVAALWSGESQGLSMAIGSLMNARGMMSLILLIIGKERGIIGPELYSILVLVSILTSLITTPVFRWIRVHYSSEFETTR